MLAHDIYKTIQDTPPYRSRVLCVVAFIMTSFIHFCCVRKRKSYIVVDNINSAPATIWSVCILLYSELPSKFLKYRKFSTIKCSFILCCHFLLCHCRRLHSYFAFCSSHPAASSQWTDFRQTAHWYNNLHVEWKNLREFNLCAVHIVHHDSKYIDVL